MARVTFVKSARKDNDVCKQGESYYWWKFRYGGKRMSLTPPKRSQLTQSNFLGQLYDLQDGMSFSDYDDFESTVDEIKSTINEMRDECQESLDNMPEQLQYAPTGELLQERIDALEEWEGEFDNVDLEVDEDMSVEDKLERIEEIRNELEACEYSL